jgi:hypothetical protein
MAISLTLLEFYLCMYSVLVSTSRILAAALEQRPWPGPSDEILFGRSRHGDNTV